MASLDKYIPSQTECPVCGLWFGSGVIAEHANSCINSAKQNDKRKRPNSDWDFMSATSQKRGNIADKATKTGKCFPCNGRSKAGNTLLKVGYLKTFSSQDGNGGTVDCEKIPKHLGHSEREGECQTNNSSECKINTCNGGHKSSSNSSFSKDTSSWSHVPLAERVRPQILHDFVGQEQAVGRNSILYTLIMHTTNIPSIILWGPPGCGKVWLLVYCIFMFIVYTYTIFLNFKYKNNNYGNARQVFISLIYHHPVLSLQRSFTYLYHCSPSR